MPEFTAPEVQHPPQDKPMKFTGSALDDKAVIKSSRDALERSLELLRKTTPEAN